MMNVIDIVIIALLLFAAVRGFMSGLFAAIASLVSVVAGVFCAIHYSFYIEGILSDSGFDWSAQTYKIVAFAVTFLGVVLAIVFIGKILTKLADITALGLINKILGAVFGSLKWALILSVLLLFFDKFNKTIPFVEKEMLDESVMFYPIKSIIPTLIPSIMDEDNPSLNFIKGEKKG